MFGTLMITLVAWVAYASTSNYEWSINTWLDASWWMSACIWSSPASTTWVVATPISTTEVQLSWNATSGVSSYKIMRWISSWMVNTQVTSVNSSTLSYSDTWKSPNQEYYYYVLWVKSVCWAYYTQATPDYPISVTTLADPIILPDTSDSWTLVSTLVSNWYSNTDTSIWSVTWVVVWTKPLDLSSSWSIISPIVMKSLNTVENLLSSWTQTTLYAESHISQDTYFQTSTWQVYSWVIDPPIFESNSITSTISNYQPVTVISFWSDSSINFVDASWQAKYVLLYIPVSWREVGSYLQLKMSTNWSTWSTYDWKEYNLSTLSNDNVTNWLLKVQEIDWYNYVALATSHATYFSAWMPLCVSSQVTCSNSCWAWTYTKNSWEVCDSWLLWTTCNWTTWCSSWWWGWGWWGWWTIETVSIYKITPTLSTNVDMIDNLSMEKINDWKIPVQVKISDISRSSSIIIQPDTLVSYSDTWKPFNAMILAPAKLSSVSVKPMWWKTILRWIRVWAEDGSSISFSKPVKLSMSIKWIKSAYSRQNIYLYSYNSTSKLYELENTNRVVDEVNEIITTDINHMTNFVLAYSKTAETSEIFKSFFKDVANHWSKDYVKNLYDLWALTTKEQYRPNDPINRAELVKMMLETLWKWKDDSVNNSFTDVPSSTWYSPYVLKAKTLWILDWYPDWTFRPSNTVNRAEALKIILKWAWFEIESSNSSFSDVTESDWFSKYVWFAVKNWIVSWYWNWKFWPWDNITRWQVAKILSLVLDLMKK